jgi:tRNA nucleotidyltransferase (CCA-adding enzyme)
VNAAASAQGARALERLRELPGGAQVLALSALREDVELVGGAVRDLLLGRAPREIDLVLDGSPPSFADAAVLFARDLAPLLSGDGRDESPRLSVHERFGTAAVRWSGGRVDIAARRTESYPHPGALPEVSSGTPEQDLQRRDFSVNAIAISLGGGGAGAIRGVGEAIEDLGAGVLRVLHDRSFQDDPTRMLRLGRYAARLGFAVEPHTAGLAAAALAEGALASVSAARIGAELRLALGESDMPGTLQMLADIGVLAALNPPMSIDDELLEDALALLPLDGRPDLLALGSMLMGPAVSLGRDVLLAALERFEQPATERAHVIEAALRAPDLSREIALADAPSKLWDLLQPVAVEAVALAGALAARAGDEAARAAAERWLTEIRHVRLQIGGGDLLAAGVGAGPEIGERLGQALRRRLDGEIEAGREAELRAALGR